jgi:hypothetical protein
MDEDLKQKIATYLYENDHEIGFCGHDISGDAMGKIIFTVFIMLMDHEGRN